MKFITKLHEEEPKVLVELDERPDWVNVLVSGYRVAYFQGTVLHLVPSALQTVGLLYQVDK